MFEKYHDSEDVYIIAEVGQNHQGSIELAKQYIETFARLGANAVKFQMRDNEYLFSTSALQRPYDNENSFGKTYGEHRNHLEFDIDEWHQIRARPADGRSWTPPCSPCEIVERIFQSRVLGIILVFRS